MYQNHVTIVLGHRGSGKSTWLFQELNSFRPYVLVDPLSDPKFYNLGIYRIDSFAEFYDFMKNGRPERVYVAPKNMRSFDLVCAVVTAKGGLTLVVDEMDNYVTNQYMPPYLKELVRYGRHNEINLVMVGRRPKDLHVLLRSQSTRFIIFPLSIEDIKELELHIPKSEVDKVAFLQSVPNEYSEYLDYDFHTKKSEVKRINYIVNFK